jgi:chorismate--pyruvate lyase
MRDTTTTKQDRLAGPLTRRAAVHASHASLLPLDLWIPAVTLLRGVPDRVEGWLTEAGLLTARVAAESGRPCRLRVLEQRLEFLNGEQQALLQVPAGTCLVREVELCAGDVPWIYAQTLVPDPALELHPWLAELGETPLGEALQPLADVVRGPFEYATLPASHPLATAALRDASEEPDFLWARRRWVAIRGRRILVHEVFLPDLGRC